MSDHENPNDRALADLYSAVITGKVNNPARLQPQAAPQPAIQPSPTVTIQKQEFKGPDGWPLYNEDGGRIVIHPAKQHIAKNKKYGKNVLPTYVVRRNRTTVEDIFYTYAIEVLGPSSYVDLRNEKRPLRCGATSWVETESKIAVNGIYTVEQLKQMVAAEELKLGKD